MSVAPEEVKNFFESRCSFKIETNSKGHNTTTHVYQGCTEQEIRDTVKRTVWAHNLLQQQLKNPDMEIPDLE